MPTVVACAAAIFFVLLASGPLSSRDRGPSAAAPASGGFDLVSLTPIEGPGGRCGYADASGAIRIAPQFGTAQFFSARSGLAVVSQDSRHGVIDRQGRFVIPPQFKRLMWAGPGLFRAMTEENRWGLLDARGRFILTPQFSDIDPFDREGRAAVRMAGRSGLIDASGRFLIPLGDYWIERIYGPGGQVGYFFEGLAVAQAQGRQFGYLDRAGRWAIPPRFARAAPFDESGLAAVAVGESEAAELLWGYIDRRGNMVVPPQFAMAGAFGAAGLAPVRLGDRWGYVDRQGAVRIGVRFVLAREFIAVGRQWLAVVSVASSSGPPQMGFVDRSGNLAIAPRFSIARPFDPNGRAVAFDRVRGAGLIDGSGRFVAEPAYSRLDFRPEISGYLAVIGDESGPGAQYGFIDRDGHPLGRGFGHVGCGPLYPGWAG